MLPSLSLPSPPPSPSYHETPIPPYWNLRGGHLIPQQTHVVKVCETAARLSSLDQIIELECDNPIDRHNNASVDTIASCRWARVIPVHYSRLRIHGGPLLAVARQTYPGHIPPIRLRAPVEVVQPVVAVLYAGAVDIGGMPLTRAVASACLAHRLSVGALRDGVLQYVTQVIDRLQPAEVVSCAPLVPLATPASDFLPKFFDRVQVFLMRLPLRDVVVVALAAEHAPFQSQNVAPMIVARLAHGDTLRTENELCILLPLFRHAPVANVLSARLIERVATLYTYLRKVLGHTPEENEADAIDDVDASLQVKTLPRDPLCPLASLAELWHILARSNLAEPVLKRIIAFGDQLDYRHLLTVVLHYVEPWTPDDNAVLRMVACAAQDIWKKEVVKLLRDVNFCSGWSSRAIRLAALALLTNNFLNDEKQKPDEVRMWTVITVVQQPLSQPPFSAEPIDANICGVDMSCETVSDSRGHSLIFRWFISEDSPYTMKLESRIMENQCMCQNVKYGTYLWGMSLGGQNGSEGMHLNGSRVILSEPQLKSWLNGHTEDCILQVKLDLRLIRNNKRTLRIS